MPGRPGKYTKLQQSTEFQSFPLLSFLLQNIPPHFVGLLSSCPPLTVNIGLKHLILCSQKAFSSLQYSRPALPWHCARPPASPVALSDQKVEQEGRCSPPSTDPDPQKVSICLSYASLLSPTHLLLLVLSQPDQNPSTFNLRLAWFSQICNAISLLLVLNEKEDVTWQFCSLVLSLTSFPLFGFLFVLCICNFVILCNCVFCVFVIWQFVLSCSDQLLLLSFGFDSKLDSPHKKANQPTWDWKKENVS